MYLMKKYINGMSVKTLYGYNAVIIGRDDKSLLIVKIVETGEIRKGIATSDFARGAIHSSSEDISKFKKGSQWVVNGDVVEVVRKAGYKVDCKSINGKGYAFDCKMYDIEKGNVVCKWDYTGYERLNGDGRLIHIEKPSWDKQLVICSLTSDDGATEVVECLLDDVAKRSVAFYENRVKNLEGTRVFQPNSGMYAEVKKDYFKYVKNKNNDLVKRRFVDLVFEDNMKKTVLYRTFRTSNIKNPNKELHKEKFAENVKGMVITNSEGERCTAVEWLGSQRVRVRFDDGVIVDTNFRSFKAGKTLHPKKGRIYITNEGFRLKIVKVEKAHEVEYQFEDGVCGITTMSDIRRGCISHKLFNGTVGKTCERYGVYKNLKKAFVIGDLIKGLETEENYKQGGSNIFYSVIRDGETAEEILSLREIINTSGIKLLF